MSKCTISVEIDEPDRQYAPGDTVSGEVTVMVNSDCRCNALKVELCWQTHGRGNYASAVSALDIPFQGEWVFDSEHRYPFEFTVPNGPYSYHGHLLNVDWYVRVSADIPWAIDPRSMADFLVGPGELTDADSYINSDDLHQGIDQKRARDQASTGCMLFFALPFTAAGLIFAFIAMQGDTDVPASVGVSFGLVFTAIGLGMTYAAVRNRLAKVKLGKVDVEFPREEMVHPGQEIPFKVSIDASARDKLNEVTATLICRERVVSGSGTNKTTHTEDIYSVSKDLTVAADASGGPRMAMETTFRLPDDAPPSFYADDNELLWLVALHVDVATWPDFKKDYYLEVRPAAPKDDEANQSDGKTDEPALESGVVW